MLVLDNVSKKIINIKVKYLYTDRKLSNTSSSPGFAKMQTRGYSTLLNGKGFSLPMLVEYAHLQTINFPNLQLKICFCSYFEAVKLSQLILHIQIFYLHFVSVVLLFHMKNVYNYNKFIPF